MSGQFEEAAAKLLQQIAHDLSAPDVVFPTSFEVTLRVQSLLKDPDLAISKLGELVRAEPLLSTKLIAYSNSAALRGGGRSIEDVQTAIMRVGLEAVRSVSYTIAMEQIIRSRDMLSFQDISGRIWLHSMAVAVVAKALARRVHMNAEKAFYLGMIHDIGAFYLLFRCAPDPRLTTDRSLLMELLFEWHAGIGHAMLSAMGQPDEYLDPVQAHEDPVVVNRLHDWTTLLSAADVLGQRLEDWVPAEMRARAERGVNPAILSSEEQEELLADAREELDVLRSALG